MLDYFYSKKVSILLLFTVASHKNRIFLKLFFFCPRQRSITSPFKTGIINWMGGPSKQTARIALIKVTIIYRLFTVRSVSEQHEDGVEQLKQ